MSDDLVRRLREGVWGRARRADAVIHAAMQDGAEHIESQAARIAELEAALHAIVNICLITCLRPGIEAQKMQSIAMAVLTKCNCAGQCNQYGECISKARAALAGGKDE